jgi:lipoprotein-anchoring transpeptidase ErfK/SrfK
VKNGGRPRMVGNEFVLPQAAIPAVPVQALPTLPNTVPVIPEFTPETFEVVVRAGGRKRHSPGNMQQTWHLAHRYSLGLFAVTVLAVGIVGIQTADQYFTAKIAASAPRASRVVRTGKPLAGLNMNVPTNQLAQTVQNIAGQAFTLTISDKTTTLDASTIKSWLQVVNDHKTNTGYIHVNEKAIAASLSDIAQKYSKAPVNQVSAEHDGASSVIATGKNGLQVSAPDEIAKDISKNVLGAKGMQETLPSQTVPFQAVTPAAFTKMIEVNVVTKQMYLYDNGQLSKTYPISAGAPETPTPIGQFKTFSKYTVEDMKGLNPNGTPYFQPHVRYINYFLPGGYAIHGNYWRPASWFGVRNSSHGCVSLPDDQAKEVFNWAPVGTTVITHT